MKNKYPENIMRKLRLREGLELDDNSLDEEFNKYTKNRVFNEVITWDGLIGWDYLLKDYILDIYGIDLDNIN